MLYESRDTAYFAASKPQLYTPGAQWCYHSGATNILSSTLRASFNTLHEYLDYPWKQLLNPIGAGSMVIQPDAQGTLVGSSFGFGTARDWLNVGKLVLQHGVWQGKQIVNKEFLDMALKPMPETGHMYRCGHASSLSNNLFSLSVSLFSLC